MASKTAAPGPQARIPASRAPGAVRSAGGGRVRRPFTASLLVRIFTARDCNGRC
jgi:hypothetical protein